jgi:hypothetical protein
LSPDLVYDFVITDKDDAEQLTRERVSVSGSGGGTGGDFVRKVTPSGTSQAVSTDLRSSKITGMLTRTATLSIRDGVALLTNKIMGPANTLTTPGLERTEIVLDSNISASVGSTVQATKTGINAPTVTVSEVINSKTQTASFVRVYDAAGNEFTVYDTVHGQGDRYARLSDVTGVIESVADTATIDLNIDSSKVLTASVKDGSITLSKLDTASVDTRYLPKNFTSPQILDWAGVSRFTFTGSGNFVSVDLGTNQAIALLPNARNVKFNDHNLVAPPSVGPEYTWDLPSASGTLALDSSLGNYVLKSGDTMSGPLSIVNSTNNNLLVLNSGTADIAQVLSKGVSNTVGWAFGSGSNGWFTVRNLDTGTTTFQISRTTNNATFTNRVTAGAMTSTGDLSVGTTSIFNGNNTHNTASDTRSTYQVGGVSMGHIQAVANEFRVVALPGSDLDFFTNGASRGYISNATNHWHFLTQINGSNAVLSNSTGEDLLTLDSGTSNRARMRFKGALNPIGYRMGTSIANGNFFFQNDDTGNTIMLFDRTTSAVTFGGTSLTANAIIKAGGTASQFLKADGSVDSNTYFVNSVSGHSVLARTTGSTGALSEVLLNTNQVLGRLSGSVAAINMADLPISTATQTALNGKQNLNSNLTELSALSGTSGLIRRTGSTYVYDNAAYLTAGDLSNYVQKTGDTMSGALNVNTASVTDLAIRHQVGGVTYVGIGSNASGSYLQAYNASGALRARLLSTADNGYLGLYNSSNTETITLAASTGNGTFSGALTGAQYIGQRNFGNRVTSYRTASGVDRWAWFGDNAESGSNSGYDLGLQSYDDSGTAIGGRALIIRRSNRDVDFYGSTITIGESVSYANMPSRNWNLRLGTSSSGAVDDGAIARWTQRVSGTNTTGYVLRWLSESRSGASMGAEVERMTLTNAGLTLTPSGSLPLTLNSTGVNIGSQIKFDNDYTTSGWRLGISSNAFGDFLIANDDNSTVPFRIAKSTNDTYLDGRTYAGATITKNNIAFDLGTTANPAWASGDWIGMRFRGTGTRWGDLVYQPVDNRYLFTSNTSGTTDLNSLSSVTMGALTGTTGTFSGVVTSNSGAIISENGFSGQNAWLQARSTATTGAAAGALFWRGGTIQHLVYTADNNNFRINDTTSTFMEVPQGGDISINRNLVGISATFSGRITVANTLPGTVASTSHYLGLDSSGNIIRTTVTAGNPFNQSLNTTDNVTFNNLTLSGSAIIGGATITGALNAGVGTFSGAVTINAGGQNLELKPGTADHSYLSFFARTATPGTRSAYVGYASPAATTFTFNNALGDFKFDSSVYSSGDFLLQGSGITRSAIGLSSGATVIKSYNSSGTYIDNVMSWNNDASSAIDINRFLTANQGLYVPNGGLSLGNGASGSHSILQNKAGGAANVPIRQMYSGGNASVGLIESIISDVSNNVTQYGINSSNTAYGSPVFFQWTPANNTATFGARIVCAQGTATRAGLNLGTSVTAPSSPADGDVYRTATDNLVVRMGTNSRTVTFNEKSQTFSGTQTFNLITATNTVTARQLAQTRQTSATSTGAITWTLSSGGTMDLTTALTGAVTMNISAPAAGGWSTLYLTQGATVQTVTLSLTGVTWRLTGTNGLNGTNTIVIPTASMVANKSFVIQLYWSTTTSCYVTVT